MSLTSLAVAYAVIVLVVACAGFAHLAASGQWDALGRYNRDGAVVLTLGTALLWPIAAPIRLAFMLGMRRYDQRLAREREEREADRLIKEHGL